MRVATLLLLVGIAGPLGAQTSASTASPPMDTVSRLVQWIESLGSSIDKITKRETLARLDRLFGDLGESINELAQTKSEIAAAHYESSDEIYADLNYLKAILGKLRVQIRQLGRALSQSPSLVVGADFETLNDNILHLQWSSVDSMAAALQKGLGSATFFAALADSREITRRSAAAIQNIRQVIQQKLS